MSVSLLADALRPGATIAFISPSLRLNHDYHAVMTRATNRLTSKGYKVRTFFEPAEGIQSNIANRLAELRAAFFDPSISAIICTIGGLTVTELLPALIADRELHDHIRANPKIFVGYSDITGLHWFLHACTGLRTFYGPGVIPELGDIYTEDDEEETPLTFTSDNLFNAITSTKAIGDVARSKIYAPGAPAMFLGDPSSTTPTNVKPTPGWQWLRPGKGKGRLFGGCLTVVARLGGIRAIVPSWRGRVVFLETADGEDINQGNPIGRVQAAFADLIAHGVFEDVAGLVVGRPYGYNTDKARSEYASVITGLFCDSSTISKDFPILFNVDFGHSSPMVTLPFDALATLDSERDQFSIEEAGVI